MRDQEEFIAARAKAALNGANGGASGPTAAPQTPAGRSER
jgi:hypothetical protein